MAQPTIQSKVVKLVKSGIPFKKALLIVAEKNGYILNKNRIGFKKI